jgi:histidinol dehydrogenase
MTAGPPTRYTSSTPASAAAARIPGATDPSACGDVTRTTSGTPATLAGTAVMSTVDTSGARLDGTDSIAPVDVIVGPGSARVAQAKREVASAGLVGVPSAFAGPSDVVVIADGSVPPEYAAIDVLLQAEHGPDGLAWLVTWDEATADAVAAEVARLVPLSSRREHLEATLAEGGYVVLSDDAEQALAVSNAIAPEHLELLVEDPDALLPLVRHAGAVFCGASAPASVGDYLAGPNHVLPTFGSARFSGALRVDDFLKHIHVVSLGPEALEEVGPHVEVLAAYEGLEAHADSIRIRLGRPSR